MNSGRAARNAKRKADDATLPLFGGGGIPATQEAVIVPHVQVQGRALGKLAELERSHRLKRCDLVVPETLLFEFGDIRNHLAGNAIGVTRDEVIAREVLKLLFCKIYDERHTAPEEYVKFCAAPGESAEQVKTRIEKKLLGEVVRSGELHYPADGGWNGEVNLDAESVLYAVGRLERYEITRAGRDIVGQAFESLIGPALRGEEGQFFTPRNVVQMAVAMVDPKPGERVIDPACGSGGFLAAVAEHMRCAGVVKGKKERNEPRGGQGLLVGIEKDNFLWTVARGHMDVVGESGAEVFSDDSLKPTSRWKKELAEAAALGSFDVVVTNPPFGAKIPIKGEQTLRQYELARVWKKSGDRSFARTEAIAPFRPPQILFIERCLAFLKDGGRMAIVLPDGILGNVNDGYVREFIGTKAELIAVVDCPLETFLPSTPTKTSVVLLRKGKRDGAEDRVFMAIADKCGHDRRGNPVSREDGSPDDDFPLIAQAFVEWKKKNDAGF